MTIEKTTMNEEVSSHWKKNVFPLPAILVYWEGKSDDEWHNTGTHWLTGTNKSHELQANHSSLIGKKDTLDPWTKQKQNPKMDLLKKNIQRF